VLDQEGRLPFETPIRTPRPRSIEGLHPSGSSTERNRRTLLRSGDGETGSQTQEWQKSSAGVGKSKKRRPAAERHREIITGWIEQYSTRKGADVDLVSHPKNEVTVTNRRKSELRELHHANGTESPPPTGHALHGAKFTGR